jgi:hypothetical protein
LAAAVTRLAFRSANPKAREVRASISSFDQSAPTSSSYNPKPWFSP